MIGNFCDDVFWDINQTWNAKIPDFSTCFQDTVFVIFPCCVFSVFGIIQLCLNFHHIPINSLPWTWRNILKLLLGVLLFGISVAWCAMMALKISNDGSVSIATLTSSFSRVCTYVIIINLMLQHRRHGVTTSSVLSLFWICFAFTGIIMHRSVILNFSNEHSAPDWNYILNMIYYPLIYVELIMSFFVDTKKYDQLERGSPLEEETIISKVMFLWFNRTVYRAYKRLLTVKDFSPLSIRLKSSHTYDIFSKQWKSHLSASELKKQSLAWVLLKSFWPWLVLGFILEVLFVTSISVGPPLIIDGILEFVKDDYYSWKGYFYCATLCITILMYKIFFNNCFMYLSCLVTQVKSALISAIYRKNLILSTSARRNFSSGGISNLISVDVYRISQFALYSTSLVCAPFRVVLIIAIMWQYLGLSCLAGVGVILTLIPIIFCLSRLGKKYTDKQMSVKDLRLKCMNEILQGIKILKFYAWEEPFSLKVSRTRKEEIKLIRLSQMCFVLTMFVFRCTPLMVSIATFSTYLFVDSRHVLDPVRAFVTLNLLQQLKNALYEIPDCVAELIQTITSLGRIKSFLISEETESDIVGCHPDEGNAATFKSASLHWSEENIFSLQDIDLNIPVGSLIAVIGPVGSGKSSLLSSILGDMYKTSGLINVKGSLAYVPQEAWILNRSVKCNILLEKPMVEEIYKKILDCCCLRPDLEILPGGDETEIGEKGINLSGGQKQRVSLARAVFQNKDIYLMDDPLSAVDAHVRKALFEDVIGNQGLLNNKTRILVTHDITVLPYVDRIIRIEEGRILEQGTYTELLKGSETFLSFIQTHSGKHEKDNIGSGDNASCEIVSDTKEVDPDKAIKKSDVKPVGSTLIEEEKMEEGGVRRGIYLSYLRHMGWFLLLLAVFGYALFTVFEAGGNIWVADWSADPVRNGTSSRTVMRLYGYAGIGLAQAISIMFAVGCMVYASTKAADLFHKEMLDSILKSPMSFFDVTPMGRITNRFSTDMDTLDLQLIYNLDNWFRCGFCGLQAIVVIGVNTPIYLASLIPLGIVYYMFLKLHLNTSRQIVRLQSTTRSPIYSHLLESIYGVSSIKAFKVGNEFIEKLEETLDNNLACDFYQISCNRWLQFWMDFIGCIVVFISTWLAITNRHTLGASAIGLIITYANVLVISLRLFVTANTQLENKSVAIERIDEYCQLPPEAPWRNPNADPDDSWPDNGKIVFDNYSTRYREKLDLVLKDISLNVHSNEKVGIIGRTGAGKSSVTLALFRIIEPAQGTILIDNIDVSKVGLHALRSKLTIIPQDPVLFTGSLRFNLDPNDEYCDDAIWKSLETSHLKGFVSGLSEGLQHSIDEGGGNLSAGQKQLLCLSRALLKKSKILILDEATAAVDMDTDSLVQDTIKSAFAKHTVITIAHRLNTVMEYDKIVVMDSGAIVEVGSPQDLLKNKDSRFFEMSRKAGLI